MKPFRCVVATSVAVSVSLSWLGCRRIGLLKARVQDVGTLSATFLNRTVEQ
jgi:hypothetical protein